MIQRTALFVAALAASLTLAVGLALAGFAPPADPVDAGSAATTTPATLTADAPAAPTVQVDTVYVAPQVKPREVTVKKTVQSSGHEDDEHEGGDDD